MVLDEIIFTLFEKWTCIFYRISKFAKFLNPLKGNNSSNIKIIREF